jgi:thiol-disulfide isomerase/thioredoxin
MRKWRVLVGLLIGLWPAASQAGGVAWSRLGFEAAREQARVEGRPLFVGWHAEWCGPCKALEREVLSREAGAELTRATVALKLDFDAAENRALVEQQVVLSLPTVIVLAPDGPEAGRVEGFESAEAWLGEARRLLEGQSTLEAAERALELAPSDPLAWVRAGHARLTRGDRVVAEAWLERAIWARHAEASPQALFVLGRFYQRVQRDSRTARHLWRELALGYPMSSWAEGAWWWYAKAEREAGAPELGARVLRTRAEAAPSSLDAVAEWGEFLLLAGLADGRSEAARLVRSAATTAPADRRPELAELAKKLGP